MMNEWFDHDGQRQLILKRSNGEITRTSWIGPSCRQCELYGFDECILLEGNFRFKLAPEHKCWFIRDNTEPLVIEQW
jgi:hypothetical protein